MVPPRAAPRSPRANLRSSVIIATSSRLTSAADLLAPSLRLALLPCFRAEDLPPPLLPPLVVSLDQRDLGALLHAPPCCSPPPPSSPSTTVDDHFSPWHEEPLFPFHRHSRQSPSPPSSSFIVADDLSLSFTLVLGLRFSSSSLQCLYWPQRFDLFGDSSSLRFNFSSLYLMEGGRKRVGGGWPEGRPLLHAKDRERRGGWSPAVVDDDGSVVGG
ncbi:hypothetical protein Scep_014714 [Stephania cephalantha]|uniref:Uncharacterized protein n=1 Tax=Stephania cephalantha TaxID=152367 RepID=A0AAP0J3P4_9MAGN